MKEVTKRYCLIFIFTTVFSMYGYSSICPTDIQFTRQASRRLVFESAQEILLWSLQPEEVVGLDLMHPSMSLDGTTSTQYAIDKSILKIQTDQSSRSALWLGGMNPFAGHVLEIEGFSGSGMTGFDFSSSDGKDRVSVLLEFKDQKPISVVFAVNLKGDEVHRQRIHTFDASVPLPPFDFRIQMLGSGLTAFISKKGLPQVVGQVNNFNTFLDLRRKEAIRSYRTRLLTDLQENSEVNVRQARAVIDTGVGLADMRAITYQDGRTYLDQGRVWYTMSIRGRTLPQHIQGVLSMDPSVFDLKLEGIILFDRGDGLLRNEIASHIFYDERAEQWRGVTTGFTAFADRNERKELLAVRSQKDPRFGISVMEARPMGLVGDYEDAHLLFDEVAQKWRMLLCENHQGYKGVVRESDRWDGGYERISGPIDVDTTGTVIQKIGDKRYCLFGSAAREIFVYSYPDLDKLGTLTMDLPPWTSASGTRVWANLIPLPKGYLSRYVLLTMDRLNYPGIKGGNWSYGALHLYHGHRPDGDDHSYEYE